MTVRSAQPITVLFTTRRFDTGAATNGDSTPTGTLYVNGTADAASVTVTNITTGLYKAAVTLPTLAALDVADLRINATVNSISDNAIVWRDSKDVLIDANGKTTDAVQTGDSYAIVNSGTFGNAAIKGYVDDIGIAGVGLTAIPGLSDLYHADIHFTRDQTNAADEYEIRWFKNGVRVTSGITVPTIQVIKRADGTDLIAATTLTQIGTTGAYKYTASTSERLTQGEAGEAVVSATIDSATRTFSRMVGRDS